MADPDVRAQALSIARNWLDTPYQHQASVKGVGCDCLGLVRGIWRTLYGAEPEIPPNYTPDWAEEQGEETLLYAAQRWLLPVTNPEPGDVLLFRLKPGRPCKHVGILASRETIIHAYWGRSVVESWLHPFWDKRIAACFAFPSLSPLSMRDIS